jgi:hypothetical protein
MYLGIKPKKPLIGSGFPKAPAILLKHFVTLCKANVVAGTGALAMQSVH